MKEKFVLLILIIEMRFLGCYCLGFPLVFFFSLNKFNYFGMKILSNSTMKYNAMQTLFVAIILIIKRSIVLPVRNVIHIFVLCE